MCFGTIEILPLEIFETIVSYLDIGDEARLYSTCRHLHIYGKPLLLDPFDRKQRAMIWAVRHDALALLKRCGRAGAPLHVVTVFKTKKSLSSAYKEGAPLRPRVCSPKLFSTLALAVRSESLDVFEHLCAQGVGFEGIPPSALNHQLRVLMKKIVSPGRLDKLRTLIERGFIAKVAAHTTRDIAWPLSRAIVAGASEELVQLFIDAGANLNATHEHRYFCSIAPLAAAILTSNTGGELARRLVRHGATYEPSSLHFRPARPTRHPLFAAVQRLAQSGEHNVSVVEDCLAHGCDINKTEHRVWDRGFNWDWRPRQQLSTPLLEFLDAIPSISDSAAQQQATIQNLAFLLDHGARTPVIPDLASAIIQSTTPSCLELLIDRWQVESLNDDHFFAIVTMLVEAGCMDGAMGRLMRRYCRGVRNQDQYFADAWRGWRRLLDLFLAQPSADPSLLLMHLLVDSGTKEMSTVERLLVAAVDYLISRGADINAPVSPLGSSALHMLCTVYQHPTPDTMWWHRSPYQDSVVQHRRDLLHLMMSRGADPLRRFCGRNAPTELIQYLKVADPSTRAWIKKVGKTLCEGMVTQRLAKANGTSYMHNRSKNICVPVVC